MSMMPGAKDVFLSGYQLGHQRVMVFFPVGRISFIQENKRLTSMFWQTLLRYVWCHMRIHESMIVYEIESATMILMLIASCLGAEAWDQLMVINSNSQPFPCVFPLRRFHPFSFPCTFTFPCTFSILGTWNFFPPPEETLSWPASRAEIHKAQVCTIYCSHQTNKTEKRKVLGPRWTGFKNLRVFCKEMSASSISGGSIRRLTKRWPAMCRLIRAWRCCTTSNASTTKTWSTFALSWISYLTYNMCTYIYICILLITVYSVYHCISFQYHYKPLVLNGALVVWVFRCRVSERGITVSLGDIPQSNSNPKALHQAIRANLETTEAINLDAFHDITKTVGNHMKTAYFFWTRPMSLHLDVTMIFR